MRNRLGRVEKLRHHLGRKKLDRNLRLYCQDLSLPLWGSLSPNLEEKKGYYRLGLSLLL